MADFNKKKKKKSFLQQAKKHGKQGNYGKGKQLSEMDFHYYIRVFEQLKQVENEDKDVLIMNFLQEIERNGNVKTLATNQIVSRIMEVTLPIAPLPNVIRIMKMFSQDLRILSTDPFASHVLQTLLIISLNYIQKDAVRKQNSDSTEEEMNIAVTEEEKIELKNFIVTASKFAYNNLSEFVCDTYASHIVRTAMEVCSGMEVSSSIQRSKRAESSHAIQEDPKKVLLVPEELLAIFEDFIPRLQQLPNFIDVICDECGSTVLQTALLALTARGDEDKAALLVEHILNYGFNGLDNTSPDQRAGIHPLFEYNATIRLLEVVLSSSTSKQQNDVYKNFFEGKISEILKQRPGHFTVKKLLSTWKEKNSFVMLYDAISVCLQDSLEGNPAVIYSLVQACRRLSSHQSHCIKDIMKLFECSDTDILQLKIVPALIYFLPRTQYEKKKGEMQLPSLSLHGTLIIQEFLKFNKPIKIVNSLMEMSSSDLEKVACDPRGSHIINAFVDSKFVGEKSREKLAYKLQGTMSRLACSKHGSRSLEAIWSSAAVKLKSSICVELLKDRNLLKEDLHGKIISTKFQIDLFKRNNHSNWEELQLKEEKKRKLIDSLLADNDEVVQPKKKKKKKKNSEDSDTYFIDTINEDNV